MRLFGDTTERIRRKEEFPYAYTFDLSNKKVYTLAQCYDNDVADLNGYT